MSRPGRPADVGGRKTAEALRDPDVTRLMHVCGENIGMVIDHVTAVSFGRDEKYNTMKFQLQEQRSNILYLQHRPLLSVLQSRYADCRCSPFGSLVIKTAVISGSGKEALDTPVRPPKNQTSSDSDTMIELGPVHWTLPGTEKTSTVEDTADPRGQGSNPTPQLVIEETENPGYVLVLQERRDDCPHQERQPFKAEDVTQSFNDFLTVVIGEVTTERSTNGPACSYTVPMNDAFQVSDHDEVPCLRLPVWWFSDEFFTRHRRHNWPPKALLDDIRRYGLHLVPVGAPGSSTERLQWRLSFSRAEAVIASHVQDVQKCAAIAFKLCKTALGEDGKMIKSYFIKTALFWLCEQTATEEWMSVTQGVLKLLNYLDHAVSTGNLPCFFWSRINLLRFASRTERKAMKKALLTIRKDMMRLVAYEIHVRQHDFMTMLTGDSNRRVSERQLRVGLIRWQIVVACIQDSVRMHMTMATTHTLQNVLPVLLRSYTSNDVMNLFSRMRHRCIVQKRLYQALNVAPEDVASRVRLSACGDGGFVWDAAPLLGLLTEDDLNGLLGDPDAVRLWLRRHHQLPETERPAGTLPADLRSPRDLCDLLLNIPLLIWVLKESVSPMWTAYRRAATERPMGVTRYVPPETETRREGPAYLALSMSLADDLHNKLGMDHQTALLMACRVGGEMQQLSDDPETQAEHRRLRRFLPDHWRLRDFSLTSFS